MFRIQDTFIEGLSIIEPQIFTDERGFFMETYSEQDFNGLGISTSFVQDNHSLSHRGVLRGLHFQREHPQAKLVRVIHGSIYDVVVDLRRESTTYGKWYGVILSAQNNLQISLPLGCAHGFLALEDDTEVLYRCSDFYHPNDEQGIIYSDRFLDINWTEYIPKDDILVSEKDQRHREFDVVMQDNRF